MALDQPEILVRVLDFSDLGWIDWYCRYRPEHACVLAAVSKLWYAAAQDWPAHRLVWIKHRARKRWTEIDDDVLTWGEPYRYLPVPTWRVWRMDVWRNMAQGKGLWTGRSYESGWHRWERCYLESLSDRQAIYQRLSHSGGLYEHLRLELSSWTWSYGDPKWKEEESSLRALRSMDSQELGEWLASR